jgi:hypothetical protein
MGFIAPNAEILHIGPGSNFFVGKIRLTARTVQGMDKYVELDVAKIYTFNSVLSFQ